MAANIGVPSFVAAPDTYGAEGALIFSLLHENLCGRSEAGVPTRVNKRRPIDEPRGDAL